MPATARLKTLPEYFWIFSNVETAKWNDPPVAEIFLRREILRELPDDATPQARLNAEVAFVDAVLQYAELATAPKDDDPEPWGRLEELAEGVPVRKLPWPIELPPGGFRWIKAHALREVVVSIDRPKKRVEQKGSRTMYHLTPVVPGQSTDRRIRPLIDQRKDSVRSRIQSDLYRRLVDVLTSGQDEAEAAHEQGFQIQRLHGPDSSEEFASGSLVGAHVDNGRDEDEDELPRRGGTKMASEPRPMVWEFGRNALVTANGRNVTSIARAMVTLPGVDVDLETEATMKRARREQILGFVHDLRSVATVTQRQHIDEILQTGAAGRLLKASARSGPFSLEQWAAVEATDENRCSVKCAQVAKLRPDRVRREVSCIEGLGAADDADGRPLVVRGPLSTRCGTWRMVLTVVLMSACCIASPSPTIESHSPWQSQTV